MSRIKYAFENKAKIAYLTAGDGGAAKSVEYFLALAAGGVNLLEIGVPYSDPVADGPVIQAAMERALKAKTTLESSLDIVSQIRQRNNDIAMILFTYYNPIQAHLSEFLVKAKAAGVDGILIVDLPFEEAAEYRRLCRDLDLAPIMVIAPSTKAKRMKQILAGLDQGFVYYACQKGTTGTREGLPTDLPDQLSEIRKVTNLPIAVGFGVANPAMVNQILSMADGCVIGSYLVKQLANDLEPAKLTKFTQELFCLSQPG